MPTEGVLQYGSQSINFYGDMAVGIGGDKWPAADCFCKMLTDPKNETTFKDLFHTKRVVELGAGTGFAGILVAQAHSTATVDLTDLADHIPLIERNKQLNPDLTNITGIELDWCNENHRKRSKYDVILALECVYNESLYIPLIETIKNCSHSDTVIYFGLTRKFASPLFFELLRSHKIEYWKVSTQEYAEEEVGMFVASCK